MFNQILKDFKLTQKQVSEVLKCNQTLVSKWCRGLCEPSMNSVIKMSETFNIPIEEIVLAFKK